MPVDSRLVDSPATELRRLVDTRDVSVAELVQASLERVERLNGTINAIVTLNPRAMDDARELDRRIARGEDPGPLCGLTVGIKDVTPVAALRTTFGSPIYADHVPDQDAEVVTTAPERGRDHPRQDQLPGVRRRRQHVQRSLRPDAQSLEHQRGAPAGRRAAAPRRSPPA